MFSITALICILVWLIAFGLAICLKPSPSTLSGGMVLGLLFLPQINIDFPFHPLTKPLLLGTVTALAGMLVGPEHRVRFRFIWFDVPVLALCACGFGASLSNGLGAYDGLASAAKLFVIWGLPYFIGRLYFNSQANSVVLIRWVIIGALLYLPFIAFESKMAPVLHPTIFGYEPRGVNDMRHALRFGLWRPTVFMEMGLQLSLFMGMSSILALWGSVSGQIVSIGSVRTSRIAAGLGCATLLCVSTGAILLTAIGWTGVLATRIRCERVLLLALLMAAVSYPVYRMVNPGAIQLDVDNSDGDDIAERAGSVKFRVDAEDLLLNKWAGRRLLGWSTWDFNVVDSNVVVVDSQWIIILTCYGILGWACWSLFLAVPALAAIFRQRIESSTARSLTPIALCVLLFWLDSLLNAFPTVVLGVMLGAASDLDPLTGRSPSTQEFDRVSKRVRRPAGQREMWPRIAPNDATDSHPENVLMAAEKRPETTDAGIPISHSCTGAER